MKNYKPILIFFCLSIGGHLILKYLDVLGSLAILIAVPFLYAVIYFLASIVKAVKGQRKDFVPLLVASVMFLMLSFRLQYTYYNVIIFIALLLIFAVLLATGRIDSRKTVLVLLIINFLLVITPSRLLLQYFNSDNRITWNAKAFARNIDRIPTTDNTYIAYEMKTQVNQALNYPPLNAIVVLDLEESTIQSEMLEDPDFIECSQLLFDLYENKRLQLMSQVSSDWPNITEEEIKESIQTTEVELMRDMMYYRRLIQNGKIRELKDFLKRKTLADKK